MAKKIKLADLTGLPAGVLRLLETITPKQRAFVLDTAEYIAGLCPRRAGKTYAAVTKCLVWGFKRDHAQIFYLAMTKDQGARIALSTFEIFDSKYDLGLKVLTSKHTVVFPNGSTVTIMGAERSGEVEKLRGSPFSLVVVDEGRSYADEKLRRFFTEVIDPGLGDYAGSCAFIGTPGRIAAGLFYEATTSAPEWSRHSWTLKDNVAMPQLWARALRKRRELKQRNNGVVPASFLVEYLGQWAHDREDLVFPNFGVSTLAPDLSPDSAVFHCSPDSVSGLLLSERPGSLAVLQSFREYFWTLPVLAKTVLEYSRNGALPVFVSLEGGLDKKFIQRLSQYLDVGVTFVEALPRHLTTPFVNDALRTNEIRVGPGVLATELSALQFDEHFDDLDKPDPLKPREFAAQLDSVCVDALLTSWAVSGHKWSTAAAVTPRVAWLDDDVAYAQALESERQRKNLPAWRR